LNFIKNKSKLLNAALLFIDDKLQVVDLANWYAINPFLKTDHRHALLQMAF
jgi:hypothetical protein